MRFNELIAGVRADLAVKVFGDDFSSMLRAANQIAAILKESKARPTSRWRRCRACRLLEFRIDKAEIARRGLSLSDVQDVIGIAIGEAQPAWCSKATVGSRSLCGSPMRCAATSMALENLPVAAAARRPGTGSGDHSAAPARDASIFRRRT